MVKPSRLLLVMTFGMSSVAITAGMLVITGKIGGLPLMARWCTGIFSIFLAFFGLYHTVRQQKHLHIHISGTGQLRITAISDVDDPCEQKKWLYLKQSSDVVSMMADSTIWPWLLLLRLKTDAGKILVLPILPDSVSRDSFRALSVACRWIAAHNNPPEHSAL